MRQEWQVVNAFLSVPLSMSRPITLDKMVMLLRIASVMLVPVWYRILSTCSVCTQNCIVTAVTRRKCSGKLVLLWFLQDRDRLAGLVVKVSASRAEDPGLESRLRWDFSGVESYQ